MVRKELKFTALGVERAASRPFGAELLSSSAATMSNCPTYARAASKVYTKLHVK